MYNNPFLYSAPYMSSAARPALTRSLLNGIKGINWSGILSNTQKTLGIINQTIPIVYQVKPILNNAKTMFKIATTLKEDSPSTNDNRKTSPVNEKEPLIVSRSEQDLDKPIFFI